jgi:hypothetical protein
LSVDQHPAFLFGVPVFDYPVVLEVVRDEIGRKTAACCAMLKDFPD